MDTNRAASLLKLQSTHSKQESWQKKVHEQFDPQAFVWRELHPLTHMWEATSLKLNVFLTVQSRNQQTQDNKKECRNNLTTSKQ